MMAAMDQSPFSLLSLEEELSCSICLCPFDCPVTIPCGHNFCQDCLLASWKDSYSCPQCRTHFPIKPELKKNTVLSTLVETFNLRTTKSEADLGTAEDSQAESQDVIRCDTCMEAEAAQTCLTCMASFCEEHLRPHRENPRFRVHQLSEPVGDLSERICPDHHKLMELFCSQHSRPICSLCLQQVHKGCSFMSPEEQRNLKESDLRGKLAILDEKITKNERVISHIGDMEDKLKDSATNRKKAVAAEYQQIRDMFAREESEALNAVDCELQSGQTKLKGLSKKFNENVVHMSKAKEDIHSLLSQSQTLAFLQASFNLPKAATFDPYTPQINLDSKKVKAMQAFCADLKEHLTEMFKPPVEDRLLIRKPEFNNPPKQKRPPRSHSPGRPLIESLYQPVYMGSHPHHNAPQHQPGYNRDPHFMAGQKTSRPLIEPLYLPVHMGFQPGYNRDSDFMAAQKTRAYGGNSPFGPGTYKESEPQRTGPGSQHKAGPKEKSEKPKPLKAAKDNIGQKNEERSTENLLDLGGIIQPRSSTPPPYFNKPEMSDIPPSITSAEKRTELLKYGTVLTLDPKTAHKRIALSEGFTKASVSDEHTDYPDCPERFSVCSQVLASQSFSRGRHYWEVRLSCNNFIGVGLAYRSIDRKGPTSRLGRNDHSWCIEWFNVKLSAWHNSNETVLVNLNPERVGVLLDCDEGTATFYNVADRAYPFHTFVFPFAQAVCPAFWIFSSGSSISVCKLQA
ncbi:E3 ubiquitin/ISG15 ligase TRIM25-like isoform X4 [Trematomus bernacchii]|uniref:E3 ubiquitin/ISG15 ligase TRIM25-like isoform X4 n=1 Tax=Trematomus bernacchii TaxID=40690 RepID=UPI00146D9B27|nr:E3 ubiquitin/ISG15 ligase TRIM25-like isoform X4 [Trematomus bernacchii]